jgi:hypothetical protein
MYEVSRWLVLSRMKLCIDTGDSMLPARKILAYLGKVIIVASKSKRHALMQ